MCWRRVGAWGIVLTTLGMWSGEMLPQASAQSSNSFRDRVLGATLSKRPGPGDNASPSTAGTLTGTERYLRSNRRGKSFVGAIPGSTGFIGAVQSEGIAGPLRNDINANREQIAATLLNPPRSPARRTGPYEPRLAPAFDLPASTDFVSSESLNQRVQQLGSGERFAGAKVSLSDRTVLLTGQVTDPRDRELLEDLLRLEPGVESVRNELVVELPPAQTGSP